MARKPTNPSRRLDSSLDAYNALHDALDLVKAVQAAGLRGVIPEFGARDVAGKVAEANAAINAAIGLYPPIQPSDTE